MDSSTDVSAFSAVAIIIASVILFIQNRLESRKVANKVARVENSTKTVEQTLTTKNGGSHVKDQLNRIEQRLETLDLRTDLEDRTVARIENTLNRHLLWSQSYSETVQDRLSRLEQILIDNDFDLDQKVKTYGNSQEGTELGQGQ